MSEADLIELIQNGMSNTAFHCMNYAYILFAFLAMSYLVGGKLTGLQAWSISILYTVFLILPAGGSVREFAITAQLISTFHENFPESAPLYFPNNNVADFVPAFIGFVLLGAWVLSLAFFTSTRSSGGSDNAT
jgi:hypothetical protein